MDAVIRVIDDRIATGQARGDVLSELVQARLPGGQGLTREEIVGEVMQMLYAGHLTIPSSLVHFWRAVAANGIGATVADEADRLCGAGAGDPDPAALLGSSCLASLKESLRLHPPAPILYREVEHAFELGGFECARGVAVWVSPELLHKDPRYFPEPDRFLPERFMKGRPAVPQSAYLPFGAGPRACIGSHLALLQMTLVCLLTARRYILTPIPESSHVHVLGRR
jgi:enediyne biosynthesis protein E7